MQLYWLAGIFGGYKQSAHLALLADVGFILFVVPHVTLVLADAWDTLRSMIVSWSATGREWCTSITMTNSEVASR
jgi:thiosulfate reductase cytochrome b subunit